MTDRTSISHCQSVYEDLAAFSFPDTRRGLALRRIWWKARKFSWHIRVLGVEEFFRWRLSFRRSRKKALEARNEWIRSAALEGDSMKLEPGDWVEVRPEQEIFRTLDASEKHKGLQFTKEMGKYCGKRFRVLHRVNKVLSESTGELRKVTEPTFVLQGTVCDGSAHGGCDRLCHCFWRGIWLKQAGPGPTG